MSKVTEMKMNKPHVGDGRQILLVGVERLR